MTDSLGDRMKEYERRETSRQLLPLLPIYARIDGRCFSAFTRGMARPYDPDMAGAMQATLRHLIESTHARIGYTQSDEISLVWLADEPQSDVFFSGKVQKMASVLAALATAAFTRALLDGPLAERATLLPHFDARVFQLPNKTEAANAFLWRELDATKNAISMAASHYYSAKELHGKSGAEKQEMLFAKGVNFNDYPASFKRGTFMRRVVQERPLTPEELIRIPAKHRPTDGQLVTRSAVVALDMPRFGSVTNREEVIFDGAEPAIAAGSRRAKTPQAVECEASQSGPKASPKPSQGDTE
jgi:tRNA(His) 5'-end guanylyltransferase